MPSDVIFIYKSEYICPKCEEGKLKKDSSVNSTQYKYICPICGYIEYRDE